MGDAFFETKSLEIDIPGSEHLQEANGEKLAFERLRYEWLWLSICILGSTLIKKSKPLVPVSFLKSTVFYLDALLLANKIKKNSSATYRSILV